MYVRGIWYMASSDSCSLADGARSVLPDMGSGNTVLYKAGEVSQGLSRVNSIQKGREAISVF
jgi:hypothetical protein